MGLFNRRRSSDTPTEKSADESKTVLIVEDNKTNMKLFHAMLRDYGYTILEAHNGAEAMDLAQQHRPDLILMDIQLPWVLGRNISGLDVTKWLKDDEDLRSIPVVVLTSSDAPKDVSECYASHANAYVRKPLDLGGYRATLRAIDRFWCGVAHPGVG